LARLYSIVITLLLSLCFEVALYAQTKQPDSKSARPASSPSEDKTEITLQDRYGTAVDPEWLETLDGEVVTVNPMTQRVLVRDIKSHRTKLINITPETIFKKGDSEVKISSLKIGARVVIKYDFMESNARLVYLTEEQKAPSDQKASKEKSQLHLK
jgi:hypothetical protein